MRQEKLAPALARYETGLRMRRFERAWEKATPEQKRNVLPLVNQAVMGFFAGGPAASAMPLDQAILALGEEKDRTKELRWGMIFGVKPTSHVRDSDTGALSLKIFEVYPPPTSTEYAGVDLSFTEITLSGLPKNLLSVTTLRKQEWHGQPVEVTLQPTEVDGILELRFALRFQQQEWFVAHRQVSIAVVKNLKSRLAALDMVKEPSVVLLQEILRKLAAGEPLETDYPGLKLLQDAEAAAKGKPRWGNRQAGQFWLTLNRAPVRLLAPEGVKSSKPLPLVIALHGAGGSENLFFDGYGDGKLARLCDKQGWLLLTTRNGQGTAELSALLEEVARLYPVDLKRVFLVGHSMGAALGSQLVSRNPGVFAAAALLGGGGVVGEKAKLPPLFVAAGASDFGRTGAEQLAQAAGVECKVYPNCEHLTVVQEALSDVIAFFEKVQTR